MLSFVLPDACVSCQRPLEWRERHVCTRCLASLEPSLRSVRLPGGDDRADTQGPEVHYALRFEGPARALVHALKYGGRVSAARVLADLAAPAARALAAGTAIDVVVPVPLHKIRLRERGFNQAHLIAAGLAAALGLPLGAELRRRRATRSQADLPRDERLSNVRGAFGAPDGAFGERRVLLIDDVVTTGATMAAASDALTAAGAASVACLAVAGRGIDGDAHGADGDADGADGSPGRPESGGKRLTRGSAAT